MAKQAYIPRPDPDFLAWLENFKTELAVVGSSVGVTGAEQTIVDGNYTLWDTKLTALVAAKAAAQAARADKAAARQSVEAQLRPLVRRIKAHLAYTPAIGEQLGIEGPEDTTDLSGAKPTLQALSVLAGAVTIGFNKSIASGIKLVSKRGSEATFTYLATDTTSPYVDNRANLAAGPETREYQAQYLDGDDPVGLLSDTLTATVPG